MDSVGLDPYEDECDDLNAFYDYCKEKIGSQVLENLDLNNNYCIYIEREISIPNLLSSNNIKKVFSEKYNGALGKYWTYMADNACQQNAYYSGDNTKIIIQGYVKPEDVDWGETIASNIDDPDEMELTVNDDAEIEMDLIKTSKGNHIIFNDKLIYTV